MSVNVLLGFLFCGMLLFVTVLLVELNKSSSTQARMDQSPAGNAPDNQDDHTLALHDEGHTIEVPEIHGDSRNWLVQGTILAVVAFVVSWFGKWLIDRFKTVPMPGRVVRPWGNSILNEEGDGNATMEPEHFIGSQIIVAVPERGELLCLPEDEELGKRTFKAIVRCNDTMAFTGKGKFTMLCNNDIRVAIVFADKTTLEKTFTSRT